ncbi:hypothetical protein [Flavicella sp.]|uniref:hypothetical protein n=1 Tax=Flavicella sp. TaxID=2957742 RepID=UPI002609FDB2|nr:hypothetical protein [Flavicella sp.]MDG1805206.1 hypothetical protein [Flavicella sp.]
MKIALKLILLIVVGLIGSGLYMKSIQAEKAEFLIGIGVSVLAFVLLPLFIYIGYKGKDLTRYSFKNMQGPENKNEES